MSLAVMTVPVSQARSVETEDEINRLIEIP